MKILSTLLLLFVIVLNINAKNENEQSIKCFETSLGKQGTINLNNSISEFDSFLKEQYKAIEAKERFKQYLKELSNSANCEIWEMETIDTQETKLKSLDLASLVALKLLILPDTVYRENNTVKSSYSKPFKLSRLSKIPQNKYLESNIASVISSEKDGFVELLGKEQFKKALEAVVGYDTLVQNYILSNQNNDNIPLQEIAQEILKNYTAEEEYFAKRIIIWEMNK